MIEADERRDELVGKVQALKAELEGAATIEELAIEAFKAGLWVEVKSPLSPAVLEWYVGLMPHEMTRWGGRADNRFYGATFGVAARAALEWLSERVERGGES